MDFEGKIYLLMLYCSFKSQCTVGSVRVCLCIQCLGDMALKHFITWTKKDGDPSCRFVLESCNICEVGENSARVLH